MKPDLPSESARQLAGNAGGKTNSFHNTPLLIDSKAAAMLLGLSSRKLWTHTNSGAIPSRKIGRSVRYSPAELRAWIDAECPTKAGAGQRIRRELSKGVR